MVQILSSLMQEGMSPFPQTWPAQKVGSGFCSLSIVGRYQYFNNNGHLQKTYIDRKIKKTLFAQHLSPHYEERAEGSAASSAEVG